jgi:delta 1-pyrroline-5-carboxylate dehydrogenase
MNAPEPSESAVGTSEIKDPATDLTASYALDPAYLRPLLARVVATSGDTVPTYCPFNGQPLAMIPQSTPEDVEEAFRRARRAQEQWARTSFEERSEKLLALHDLILDRQKEITDLI